MNLLDLVRRTPHPEPWAEGEKIPWNDPDFSARMLKEHLTQTHDAASRRATIIDQHVNWIHTQVLPSRPAHILDLGCGPGLYASRLAALGHTCTGLDFSPASIAYAREQAAAQSLACTYTQGDIRQADFGSGYDLVMFIYGEFNVFTREDAGLILRKAHAALKPGGTLLLEPHTYEAIRDLGQAPATWYSSASGLFSEQPHLVLNESFWDEARDLTTNRYYIVDAASGQVTRHASTMQAYHEADYRALLTECGYDEVSLYPSLAGGAAVQPGLIAIRARRNS